jgi:nitric oxide reductase large subunit
MLDSNNKENNSEKIQYTHDQVKDFVTFFSTKTSEIIRQLGLAGVAISWIFMYNEKTSIYTPKWIIPTSIFILAIIIDLFQYSYATNIYSNAEKKDALYEIEKKKNDRIKLFFYFKKHVILFAYLVLFGMIIHEVYFAPKLLKNGTIDASHTKQMNLQKDTIKIDKKKP